jgi:PTS system mannose-specific IIB component
MSVVLARVDNRLVHGQILSAWVPALNIDCLIVLDDEAAANTLVRSAMEIAIPPDVQFEVYPVARAAEALASIAPKRRALILLRDVSDAVRAIDAGLTLSELNLGNVHYSHGRAPITQAVYLSADEVAKLEGLAARKVSVEVKTLPSDMPINLAEVGRRVAQARPG